MITHLRRRHLHQPLLRPVHQIIRLPNCKGQTPRARRLVPRPAAAVHLQVGRDDVEGARLGVPDDEGVADALVAEGGGEDGRGVVDGFPGAGGVAVGDGWDEVSIC